MLRALATSNPALLSQRTASRALAAPTPTSRARRLAGGRSETIRLTAVAAMIAPLQGSATGALSALTGTGTISSENSTDSLQSVLSGHSIASGHSAASGQSAALADVSG